MHKKIFCVTLLLIALCSCASVANAAITASDYINRYNAHINADYSQTVEVVFSIDATGKMDKIGVKTIVLQERANDSANWESVKTYKYETTSGMLINNSRMHDFSVFYYDAIAGYSYRAKVYFYAEKGGYDTREFITPIVKAK